MRHYIQNSTSHVATIPTGNICFIENPITNEKPKYYQVHDFKSIEHNVSHTYHPEFAEFIVPTKYSPSRHITSYAIFSLNQVFMTDLSITSKTPSSLYNFQTSSHTTKPRVFPSLPYTKGNLKFVNKFNFKVLSDSTDYLPLCSLLIQHKICDT